MTDKKPEPARASVFSTPDLSGFKPKERPAALPTPDDIDRATAGSKFSRGDALSAGHQPTDGQPTGSGKPPEGRQETKRRPLVYRTGRNQTISVKTTAQTIERFYQMAVDNGWKAAETFEKAVEALEASIKGK